MNFFTTVMLVTFP